MDNRPDLPSLEAVKEGGRWRLVSGLLLLLFPFGFTGMLLWIFVKYFAFMDLGKGIAIAGLSIMVALCLWVTYGMLATPFSLQTSSEDVQLKGVLRKKFIRWTDVEKAVSKPGSNFNERYTLQVVGSRAIRLEGLMHNISIVQASVWQHLRRIGKADQLTLSKDAESLWDTIPDQASGTIEWARKPISIWLGPIIVVLVYGPLLVFAFFKAGERLLPSIFTILLVLLVFAAIGFRAVSKARFREGSLDLTMPLRTVTVKFNELKEASWLNSTVVLKSTHGSTFKIPLVESDINSCKLILSIIRELRNIENPIAVSIPWQLRDSVSRPSVDKSNHNKSEDVALLKYSSNERVGVPLFCGFYLALVGFLILQARKMPIVFIALPIVGIIGFLFFLLGKYSLSADRDGIVWRSMRRETRLRWSELTDIVESPISRSNSFLLRDTSGRLRRLVLGMGSKADKQRFSQFVRARAAEILGGHSRDLWKSRPWTPEDKALGQ